MLRLPILALFCVEAFGSLQEDSSLLQTPAVRTTLGEEQDKDECRCPGYFREQCEAEAAQGCIWSDAGSSNKPWCQCGAPPSLGLPEPVPAPPPQPQPVPEPVPAPPPELDCDAHAIKGNDGNGIVSTGNPDGASAIQFIDLGAGAFENAGEIRSVRYHVARANQADQKFQIYRPVSDDTYHLVSETEVLVSTQAGEIVTQEFQTPLQFQAGDYIGWVHSGRGTFPFRGGGGSVRWRYRIQGVGSDIDFNGAGARIYAYEVTYTTCGGDADGDDE